LAAKQAKRGSNSELNFAVNNFFLLGSPLGVFLSLRGERIHPNNQVGVFPKCSQLFNVFHPYDPVAYRLEPLILKNMSKVKPAYIVDSKGKKRFHIEMQEKGEELVQKTEELKKSFVQQWSSLKNLIGGKKEKDKDGTDLLNSKSSSSANNNEVEKKILETLGDGRIDYVLQDNAFENPVFGAVLSHLSYWKSEDTAMFILRRLLGKDGVLQITNAPSPSSSSPISTGTTLGSNSTTSNTTTPPGLLGSTSNTQLNSSTNLSSSLTGNTSGGLTQSSSNSSLVLESSPKKN